MGGVVPNDFSIENTLSLSLGIANKNRGFLRCKSTRLHPKTSPKKHTFFFVKKKDFHSKEKKQKY